MLVFEAKLEPDKELVISQVPPPPEGTVCVTVQSVDKATPSSKVYVFANVSSALTLVTLLAVLPSVIMPKAKVTAITTARSAIDKVLILLVFIIYPSIGFQNNALSLYIYVVPLSTDKNTAKPFWYERGTFII